MTHISTIISIRISVWGTGRGTKHERLGGELFFELYCNSLVGIVESSCRVSRLMFDAKTNITSGRIRPPYSALTLYSELHPQFFSLLSSLPVISKEL
jgi:hypothetical protein